MASRNFDAAASPLRVFGAELRHYRAEAGMSQDQLGALAYCSGDLISKMENGQRVPTEELTAALDTVPQLDTRGALMRLREELREYLTYQATPGWLRAWEKIERQARTLLWWEPLLIPGLLQTREYAREVLRRGQPGRPDTQIEQQVQARMDRQQILDGDDPPMLIAVVDAGTLRRPVGGRAVMHAQLTRLLELAERTKIVLQVVPVDAGPHPGTAGPMAIASLDGAPDVAYLDTALEGQLVEGHADVAAIALLYDTLRAEALPVRASMEFIAREQGSWT
jgi:transcriptional regulator with XRE-family HTH domain